MFKNCKENQCLNRDMIDFLNRQFSVLKQLARNTQALEMEVICDQINECVELMERRIIFVLDEKNTQQFHDYLSDFYEEKMQRMRSELSKQITKCKQFETKIQELIKIGKSKQESFLKSKPLVDFTIMNENATLKNKLIQSQELIKENQALVQEQYRVIDSLEARIGEIEDKQMRSRVRCDAKILQLDDMINSKKKQILRMNKDLQKDVKRLQKQYREVQHQNISLLQEKDRLESQLIIKSEEIKLLSKKIYDQSIILNKFQRTIDQNQGVLMVQKIENNRAIQDNKIMKQKLKDKEKLYESKLQHKSLQIIELQRKITYLTSENDHLQDFQRKNSSNFEKLNAQIKSKNEKLQLFQQQFVKLQIQMVETQKQQKKAEKRQKQLMRQINELQQKLTQRQQEINQLKQLINRMKKDGDNTVKLHQRQKSIIKSDIQSQFQRLTDLNKQILTVLQAKQKDMLQISKQYQQSKSKINELRDQIAHISDSFEDAKNKVMKIQQQKKDINYVREQLQIKLKHTERKCQQFQKIQQERDLLFKNNAQLEEIQIHSRKTLKQKQAELEKYKKMLQQQNSKNSFVQKGEVKLLKEELTKKQFQLKQSCSKVNLLQQQLRQAEKSGQIEREKMGAKIRQLQIIIQERFDLTNRLLDSSVL